MSDMAPRVPDEYFRKRAGESDDVRESPLPETPSSRRPQQPVFTPLIREGIPPRLLLIILVLVIAVSFAVGRLLVFRPAAPEVEPVSETTEAASSSLANLAPFDGAVQAVAAGEAAGECLGSGSREAPSSLLDDDPSTIWRCPGDGEGESITFTFDPSATLVGMRLVNGNTAWTGRYESERRILSIRWQFSDGSYFVQGLAANERGFQEVRFPETESRSVTMTVESVTEPDEQSETLNAVSISALEFLAPA